MADTIPCRRCGGEAHMVGEVDGDEPGTVNVMYECDECRRRTPGNSCVAALEERET